MILNQWIICVFFHARNRHQCAECPKYFTLNRNLLRHQREKHEGVSHPCIVCGKEFSRNDALNKHLVVYHGDVNLATASAESEWVILPTGHGTDEGNENLWEIDAREAEDLEEWDAGDKKGDFNQSPIAAIGDVKINRRSEKRDVEIDSGNQTDGTQVKQEVDLPLKLAMFCSKCGTKFIFADDQFCTVCGARRQVLK